MRVLCARIAVLAAVSLPRPLLAEQLKPAVAVLHVSGQHDRAEVTVEGNFRIPSYSIDTLDDGKQVIIHVDNAVLAEQGLKVDGSAKLVVRSSAASTAKGVRIVVTLTQAAAYRARGEDGKIRVLFDAIAPAQQAAEAPVEAPQACHAPGDAAQIKYVGIERRNGRERVVIDLDHPTEFRIVPGGNGPARMEIEHSALVEGLPKQIKGEDGSVVRSIQVKPEPGRVTLQVERASRRQRDGDSRGQSHRLVVCGRASGQVVHGPRHRDRRARDLGEHRWRRGRFVLERRPAASRRAQVGRSLQRPAHRSRFQRRRHPQHPSPSCPRSATSTWSLPTTCQVLSPSRCARCRGIRRWT